MRYIAIFCLIAVLSLFSAQAYCAVVVPDDLPTIEALIALHKSIKSEEDKATVQLSLSYMEQGDVTKKSLNYNEVRNTLNSKLNNGYSYVLLAAALSSTATSLYKLIDEYKDFSSEMPGMVSKKPFVAFYYANAHTEVANEIKHAKKIYLSMSASGLNLMKATMDEKLNLLFSLQSCIDNARGIITRAKLYCDLVVNCGWKPRYIDEILNSSVRDAIVEGIVNQWKNAK